MENVPLAQWLRALRPAPPDRRTRRSLSGPLIAASASRPSKPRSAASRFLGSQADRRHLAPAARPMLQPRAVVNDLGPRPQAQSAGDISRRRFAEAMADDGRRLDAPRPPKRRQSDLQCEQQRLNAVGVVEPAPRRSASRNSSTTDQPASGPKTASHSSTAVRNTGSRFEQSPAHAPPLRPLAGEHPTAGTAVRQLPAGR